MRFADPTVCVRDKVCWASVPRAGIPGHLAKTIAGSGQCHEVFAWSSVCLLELQTSGFRRSCCSAHRDADSLQTSSIVLQPGGRRPSKKQLYLNHV